MKNPKISEQFRARFAYFLEAGKGMSFDKNLPFDAQGMSALEAFHALESRGERLISREPKNLAQAICGKKAHAITVRQKAEAWREGTYLRDDLEAELPWVRLDIQGAIRRAGGQNLFLR